MKVARERRWESSRRGEGRGGREVAEYGAGSNGTWCDGTETGDAQVGELYCVETQRQEREIGKGREQVPPSRTDIKRLAENGGVG